MPCPVEIEARKPPSYPERSMSVLCWTIQSRARCYRKLCTVLDMAWLFRGSLTFYRGVSKESCPVLCTILLALGAAGRCSVVASDCCPSSLAYHAHPLGLHSALFAAESSWEPQLRMLNRMQWVARAALPAGDRLR